MKLADLEKWKKNPRKITPSKARILAKTLQEFGDLSGIVFNKKNNCIISGHQRCSAIDNAEIQIVEQYDTPTKQGTIALGYAVIDKDKYSYREVVWDEEKHAAAAIAANKGAGEWDFMQLKDLMLELDSGAFDMELTGFELPELENMLGKVSDIDLEEQSGTDKKYILTLELDSESHLEEIFREMASRGIKAKFKV